MQSQRDFGTGTLIQTSMDYSTTNGAAFLLEIKGNSYSTISGIPRLIMAQGYMYNNTLINVGGISTYQALTIQAFNYNGKLCFWFGRTGYWDGYDIFVSNVSGYSPTRENLVTSVTDSGIPSGVTKQVAIVLNTIPLFSYDGNGYPSIQDNNGCNGYLRTPGSGIIPPVSGGAANCGTPSWPFANIYGNSIYRQGRELIPTSAGNAQNGWYCDAMSGLTLFWGVNTVYHNGGGNIDYTYSLPWGFSKAEYFRWMDSNVLPLASWSGVSNFAKPVGTGSIVVDIGSNVAQNIIVWWFALGF
jgi:hypothetical protein